MTGDLLDLDALSSLGDDDLEALRSRVADAGFDTSLLGDAERIAPRQFDAVRLPLVHGWLRGQPGSGAILARLFAYRDDPPVNEVRGAVGERLFTALIGCGALVRHADRVRSRLRLMPFGGFWVGSDEADARHDPVMGPGATTLELLRAMPSEMPARVLDVGCGAGSLALAAAHRGAASVLAVDLDPRAVALTTWNARLNGLEVDARVGSLMEPAGDARFDLIVAQPPFVPQPPDVRATTYLHGGHRGDELALTLLAQLHAGLVEGGRALVLMDTAPPTGSALDRVRAAVGEIPLQLCVVDAPGHGESNLALGYAAAADSTLGPAYADAARHYAAHLESLEIRKTRHLLVELRRPRSGDPAWAVSVEPRAGTPYDAQALARLGDAMRLATLPSEALVRARVSPPAGARLVQIHPLDGSPGELRFVCPGGRVPDQALSDAAARLLELASATETVTALIDAYAQACSDDRARVEGAVLSFLRQALVSGLLEPGASP